MNRLCFSLKCFGVFVENQLTLYVLVYFWTLFQRFVCCSADVCVLITAPFHKILKSGGVNLPALTSVLLYNLVEPLYFHINFTINVLLSVINPIGLTVELTVLNLESKSCAENQHEVYLFSIAQNIYK